VKGVHLEGLRVLGKPEHFARYYYEQGADELIYMDVVASLYERNSLHNIIQRTSKEIFIPLTVGGGLRTVDDIRTVLQAGADKVSLNTAVTKRPELIREISKRFGSSTIVVSIEAKKRPDGSYEVYTDNGRVRTGVEVFKWAVQVAELGAGEILLTSIDREGTGEGFDIDLTRRVAESVPIPVIACGGAGKIEHVYDVVARGKADAVCVASILHYNYFRNRYSDDDYSSEGNIEFLRSGHEFSRVQGIALEGIKAELAEHKILCRPIKEEGIHVKHSWSRRNYRSRHG
jgi:cyclase